MSKRFSFLLFSAVTLTAFESAVDYSDPLVEQIIAMEQTFEQEQMPCIISQYDNIMRKIAAEQGQDWRLMSAIAYSESRFTEDLVSRQGAAGIMQIRPIVARHFNIPVEMIDDVETNIRLAGMLLSELDHMLRLPASTPASDRLSIILASYNAGVGHVMDARRLARINGENPNSWETVSRYLELKADPAYYENEAVRNGRFTGSRQTNGYVREVMRKYTQYCALAS
ncbi:MAG: transglycosylase SLT domain-containing protein [Alistipes sp.]|nr:transglycosylase SLT domain-containing protein [Alistipes sp.]MDE7128967.1 transglycosylase SLT domain-containing protein [Alistipes sp.]